MNGIRKFCLSLITLINIIGPFSIYFFLYNKALQFSINESLIIFLNIIPIFFSCIFLLVFIGIGFIEYCPNCQKCLDKKCCEDNDYDYDNEVDCKVLLICLGILIFIQIFELIIGYGIFKLRKIALWCNFVFELLITFLCANLYLGESSEKKYLIILAISFCLSLVNIFGIIVNYFCNCLGDDDSPEKDKYINKKNEIYQQKDFISKINQNDLNIQNKREEFYYDNIPLRKDFAETYLKKYKKN